MASWRSRPKLAALCVLAVVGPALAGLAVVAHASPAASAREPRPSGSRVPQTLSLVGVVGQVSFVGGAASRMSVYVAAGPRYQGEDVDLDVAPGARVLIEGKRLLPFDGRAVCGLFRLTVTRTPSPSVTHAELVSHENQCLRNVLRSGRPLSATEARSAMRQNRRSLRAARSTSAAPPLPKA